jgi:hypothetical protein
LCDKDGKSPLFAASEKGKCDVVKCLLSHTNWYLHQSLVNT